MLTRRTERRGNNYAAVWYCMLIMRCVYSPSSSPPPPSMFDIEREPAVSVLSTEHRTTWAKAREHMKELDAKNGESLDVIEKARAIKERSKRIKEWSLTRVVLRCVYFCMLYAVCCVLCGVCCVLCANTTPSTSPSTSPPPPALPPLLLPLRAPGPLLCLPGERRRERSKNSLGGRAGEPLDRQRHLLRQGEARQIGCLWRCVHSFHSCCRS